MTPREIEKRFGGLDKGPDLIREAINAGLWFQVDLARASGIPPQRITDLKNGSRPTRPERAAILWALALRLDN